MAYANYISTYFGGPRTFTPNFATGVRSSADIKVAIDGELTGGGNQRYRDFTYNTGTGVVTVTDPIAGPYPRIVRIERNTPITNPAVDFSAGAVISRANLHKAFLQVLRGAQEAHDNDAFLDARMQAIEDIDVQSQVDDAVAGALEDAEAFANAAAASAGNAATSASQAATMASNAATSASNAATQANLATTNGAAQVALAAEQVTLAAAEANEAAGHAADAQTSLAAVQLLTGDLVGAVVIPCSAEWNSELGTGTITLTPLTTMPPIATGLTLRFRAPVTISGNSPLIRIGSTFYGSVKNRTGATVPGSYIRTDLDTILIFDGTNFRAGRDIERGSNANGHWVRFEDGSQHCTHQLTGGATNNAAGSIFSSANETWTFPIAFDASATADLNCWGSVLANGRWCCVSDLTNTVATFRQWNSATNAATTTVRLTATGRWYD